MSAGGPWQDAEQARAYAEFCARWTLYADTSGALADAAGVGGDLRVADLGCGTGETARACLQRLGPGGRLVGVDPAARMIDAAAAALGGDARAAFVVGDARDLPDLARAGGAFDRILCNSALWLDDDPAAACRAAREALSPSGAFAFSLPAEYAGEADHLLTPDAVAFAAALGACRAELAPAPALDASPPPAAADLEARRAMLADAGFAQVEITRWARPWPLDEALAWLAMPVVASGLLPGAPPDARARLIPALRARLPAGLALETRWLLVVARP